MKRRHPARPLGRNDALRQRRSYKTSIDTAVRGQVAGQREQLLDATLDRMLGMVERGRYRLSRVASGWQIVIAGVTITLDPVAASFEHDIERLASAIEASIAHERASAMLAAAGAETGPLPLWMVTGSSVLAHWLAWSRHEAAFRRRLALSNHADLAPVVGSLKRSARTTLGQTPANIRIGNGLAVARKIELSAEPRCIMMLGQKARLTIARGRVPETIVAGSVGRNMTDLAGHPFFTAANLVIKAARNEEQSLVIDLDHRWGPLALVPEAALAAVPADADPACPWRPTRREVAGLYALVDALRGHEREA